MMMKKAMTMLLSLLLAFSLTACGSSTGQSGQSSAEEDVAENAVSEDGVAESSTDDTIPAGTQQEEAAEGADRQGVQETEAQEADHDSEVPKAKVLVAYFSATNTTEGVAEHIADGLHADLYEIVPEEPYTDADLDYHDNNSRTTIEMNDPDIRPAIQGSVEDMEQYDVVFLGYPIWWGDAPRIISTFMESYDFSGKTVIPFCTSGGSGIDSSVSNLEKLTEGAEWLTGKRLNGSDSEETVMEWVDGLGLE